MSIIFSEEEVALHNTLDDCWIIANGNVYNVTTFINRHPGGKFVIKSNAGSNVTKHFKYHSQKSHKIWEKYLIGEISKSTQCGCL